MNLKIIQILEEYKIKATPMRMLVLEQLISKSYNLSLSDIEKSLYPSDRITIYRTLQTFVKQGLVHSFETANNGTFYALCSEDCKLNTHTDNHPHFICESCKKVICNHDFVVKIESTKNSKLYKLNKVEVTLKGLCPDCANR